MPDDLKRKVPEDPRKINIDQGWEIEYWSKELGVSKLELEAAVTIAGHWVTDVKRFLGKK